MRVLVLVDVHVALGLVTITAHHCSLKLCTPGVHEEGRVAVHLPHEVLIHGVDARRDGVGPRRDDLQPFRPDDVHGAALVCLGALDARRVGDHEDGCPGEAFVDERLEQGPDEALDAHVVADRLRENKRASARVLLADDRRRRKTQVHAHHDRTNAIGNMAKALSGHVIIRTEVLIHRQARRTEAILTVDVDPDVLLRPALRVVVALGEVLDVFGIGASPRWLLEHRPTVVVGADPILRVESLHLVVPPRVHGRRVGISPHPVPCGSAILGGRKAPDTLGHGVHDVGVDVAALVEPREGQLQRVQVRHIIRVVQRAEHDLALDVADLEEIGLGGAQVLAAHPRREPVEEGLDGGVLKLARGFADDRRPRAADALLVGSLKAGPAHHLEGAGHRLARADRPHEHAHLGVALHELPAGGRRGIVDLKRHGCPAPRGEAPPRRCPRGSAQRSASCVLQGRHHVLQPALLRPDNPCTERLVVGAQLVLGELGIPHRGEAVAAILTLLVRARQPSSPASRRQG